MKNTPTSPSRPLVIVESPNKLKSISKILGDDYNVQASYGHFADIPAKRNAIDVDNGFSARYELSPKGSEVIENLRREMRTASELILATDDDREGEMIAALLVEFLQPTIPVSRIAFRAITKFEVLAALENRRAVNPTMVEAARTRRYLDHLYGFVVSPVLWSNVRQNLGVGRVKAPALRLLVEREEARLAFMQTAYCGVSATLAAQAPLVAELRSIDGTPVAKSNDIDDAGVVAPPAELLLVPEARALESALTGKSLTVIEVKQSKYTRKPPRPYTTTDLLSDILSRMSISAGAAQGIMNQLYEKSLISYPRTDSPSLSRTTTEAARQVASDMFGAASIPDKPNFYFPKRKTAQEAHEAIRPANMANRSPKGLTPQQSTVYDLVWRRTVASQMINATGTTTSVTFEAITDDPSHVCHFAASGTTIEEPGFMRITTNIDDLTPTPLASLATGDEFEISDVEVTEHTTKPPARYTIPTLIRALEEREIGRPSTYAPIIDELRREYVWSKDGDKALIPTLTAVAVHQFMAACFPALIDDEFTRDMELRLNDVVDGKATLVDVLGEFHTDGTGDWPGLVAAINNVKAAYDPRNNPVRVIGLHPESGEPIVLKPGRSFGRATAVKGKRRTRTSGSPYLTCDGRNAAVPDHTELSQLTVDFALQLFDAPRIDRELGEHDGSVVALKSGPHGPYVKVGTRNVSLPASLDATTLTLDDVVDLLAYPKVLGTAGDEDVLLKHGRYGFYVDKAGDTRPLGPDVDPTGFTLEAALALLAQPKKRRGKR
jgi:DNA topoisomerase I